MTVPEPLKDQAVYHTILADMHRMHALLLNLRTLGDPDTSAGLREYFGREQTVVLGRLREWRQRRADIYRAAESDFAAQVRLL